jgi:predicted permease
MEWFWRDLKHGARSWRRTPGLASIVVLTFAFGVGANTTAFSLINTLFLSPLPVERPNELVAVRTTVEESPSGDALAMSHLNLKDVQSRNQVFESLAGHSSPIVLTLLSGDTPQRLFGELVTANYFETLGILPIQGRFFLPDEDATPAAAPVLVVAHSAWRTRFGGAADILGRKMPINGVVFTVVGVAPEGFKGVNAVFGPDVWIPSMMAEAVLPAQNRDWLRNRSALGFRGVARLKAGVSPEQAAGNVDAIASALQQEYPDENRGRRLAVDRLTRASLLPFGGMSASTISLVMLSIPALLLLIACANVASLLLARARAQRQEIAVRLALGSDRTHLLRQLLTESLMLACVGGIVGFAVAYGGVQILQSFRPPEVAANLIDMDVDLTVLLFAVAVSLAAGLLAGLLPSLQSTQLDVLQSLTDDSRTSGPSRGYARFSKAMTMGQVTLSLMALVTAGLLLRSLQQAYSVHPGFEPSRLGLAMINPGQAGYSPERSQQFLDQVRSTVAAMPGVVSASWATQLPLFARPSRTISAEGREQSLGAGDIISVVNVIDVNYFATVGTPIVMGRDLLESDRDGAKLVAVVNETLAAHLWPGTNPIGRRLRLTGEGTMREIVGVAKVANYTSVGEAPQFCVYLPIRQQLADSAVLYVRTQSDPTPILGTVQRTVRAIDRHVDVNDVRTVQTLIGQSLFGATIGVGLLSTFGVISLGLASLGLYGAVAYAVRQRRREIGVRMALGANRGSVLMLILRQALQPIAFAIILGSVGSAVIGRLMSNVLFGVSPVDPVSLITAAAILLLTGAVAGYLPARRASRIDPVHALREH